MRCLKSYLRLVVVITVILFFAGLAQAEESGKIDINRATVEELTQIKGIGEAYAKRIVEYRDENGDFEKKEDIMQVKGIGAKRYETIKDSISVGKAD